MIFSSKQKAEIIKYCKDFVEHNGTIRVGYAIEQVTGEKGVPNHVKEKIANTIIQTGEYLKERSEKTYFDLNILKNPNYKEQTWIERNPISFEIIKALITAIFAIIVSVV